MSYATRFAGIGSYVPPKVVTNHDLEGLMDTSDEWIQQRTGIQSRHWVDSKTATSDLALEASKKALDSAGIEAKDLDMIIFATLSPDHDFPGSGCFLQAKLGIPEIPALDIRQQCSGFVYGLSVADQFLSTGKYKRILLVGAEIHSKGLDKTTRGRDVSVLFGDGAGAVVLESVEAKDDGPKVYTTDIHADGSYAKELWLPAAGSAFENRIDENMLKEGLHYPQMNGKTVFVHAVKRMCESLTHSMKETGLSIADIDVFLFHQANLRINSKVAEAIGIPEEKVFNTIQKFGNTTAATIPLGMDKAIEAGVLKRGMTVGSAAFGSGFTWGSAIWKY
ncbi:MAG: 3-oxoacyl-ACP synthase III family protein [Bacteriovoracaceae bacterium]